MATDNDQTLLPLSKRDDATTKLRKQAAANALQQYSLLAIQSLNEYESPAKTRLRMMRIMTDLPEDQTKGKYNMSMRKRSFK